MGHTGILPEGGWTMNDKMVSAGQNQEPGKNPKAEQDPGEVFFQEAALFLAETYGRMLDDRGQLKAVIDAGVIPYTEEIAIRDLSAVSVGYDTEWVQTSNISNIPERIAALLDSGYVEKMNRRLKREMDGTVRDYTYLCWKIELVETVMKERMRKKEQDIFERVFLRKRTYRQICAAYKKGTLHNKQISQTKKKCLQAIADHLKNASCFPMYSRYMDTLRRECQQEKEREE